MSHLLGIDVGTTATKALLLDPERGVVAEAERPTRLHSLHAGWAEEDTAEWWDNVCATARELCAGVDIAGVSILTLFIYLIAVLTTLTVVHRMLYVMRKLRALG